VSRAAAQQQRLEGGHLVGLPRLVHDDKRERLLHLAERCAPRRRRAAPRRACCTLREIAAL
jgi:hypothetical protein